MHKIQLACPNYKEFGKDRSRICEFLPWRDMVETPGKIPEEYPCYWGLLLLQDFLLKRGWKCVPRAATPTCCGSAPCPAPVQSVWQTHPAGIILSEQLSVEGGNEVRWTQIEKHFFKAALCCLSSLWRAKDSQHTTWEGMDNRAAVVLTTPTHTVVVTAVHISSQGSNNLTWFQAQMQNLGLRLQR